MANREVISLSPGQTIKREVAAGQGCPFQVTLPAGHFACLIVTGEETCFTVTLISPSHQKIYETASRWFNPAFLSFITDISGTYTLDVRSLAEAGDPAHCEVIVDQVRLPVAQDITLIAAEKAAAEAEKLRAEWRSQSFTRCIEKYKQAQIYWHRISHLKEEAGVLKNIGEVYATLGQNANALTYFNQALSLSRAAEDHLSEINILNDIAEVEIDLGEWQIALDNVRQALAFSDEAGFIRGKAQALDHIGLVYHSKSELQKALDTFDQALILWRTIKDRRGQAQTLLYLGYSHSDSGHLKQSLDVFNQALTLWRQTTDLRGEALTLTAIALLDSSLGEMQKAFETHTQALHLFQMMGDQAGTAVTLNALAYIYETLGDGQKALTLFNQALKCYQAADRRSSAAITLGLIAHIYYSLGDRQKALTYYTNSLNILRSLSDHRMEAYTLREMGIIFNALGEQEKALDYFNRALTLGAAASDPRSQAAALNSLGYIYEQSGQKEKALDFYNCALTLNHDSEDRTEEAQTLHNIARLNRDLNRLAEAREQTKALLNLVEMERANVASQELQASYFASAHQHYELYIDILMRLHKQNPAARYDAEAFEASERSCGRVLLDLLSEARASIRQDVDPTLRQQEHDLQELLNTKADQQINLLKRAHTEGEAAAIKQELADITSRYDDVLAQIRASNQKYADLTHPRTLRLVEIQRQILDADSLVLEYSLGEEQSYLWAVTSTWAKVFELPSRNQIEAAAIRLYRSLTAPASPPDRPSPRPQGNESDKAVIQSEQAAAELTQMLLGPVAPYLATKRLIVVADGALQYVPFSALWDPNALDKEGKPDQPLMVNHEIVSLPSVSVLAALRSEINGRRSAPKALAVFADPVFERDDPRVVSNAEIRKGQTDRKSARTGGGRGQSSVRSDDPLNPINPRLRFQRLPFAFSEAKAITSSLPEQERRLALGFEATLAAAKSPDLQQYRILHFATHGLIFGESPQLYGIVLSLIDRQGKPQDGFLRLNEVYNLKLDADLVVLSACQTALGKDIRGEGLVGLSRGFMHAGAARVIASLWKVDDRASAEMMKYFYEAMFGQAQLRPAAALRAAQIRMWQQQQWKSPYFWAAFILQGEWK